MGPVAAVGLNLAMSGAWIAAFLALSILVTASVLLQLGALRRLTPLLEEADRRARANAAFSPRGLSLGDELPRIELALGNGGSMQLSELEVPAIVLFVDDRCEPCHVLAAELELDNPGIESDVVVVLRSEAQISRWRGLAGTTCLDDGRVARAFDSNVIPHAFAIDRRKTIAANVVPTSLEHLRHVDRLARRG